MSVARSGPSRAKEDNVPAKPGLANSPAPPAVVDAAAVSAGPPDPSTVAPA